MLKYVEDAGVKNRMFVLARSADPIARTSISAPVRFAFIDGDHRYEQVKADIEWLLPLMADGGVMALDDMYVNKDRWGVTQAYEEVLKPRVRKVLFGDTGACQFFEVAAQ
jgi:predicted O-methyltransferase YrrM